MIKTLIIDNGSSYLASLKALTLKYSVPTIKKYRGIEELDKKQYDVIILSGGHKFSVIGHKDEFAKELDLIKEASTPILGICLGFELIAHSFGAKMLRMKTKEKNILHINKLENDPIFANIGHIKVFESHRWVVTDTGDTLIPLANSKDGIEIIKHKEQPMYGFQFHPEMFPDQTQGDELFANFIKIVQNKNV